MRLEFDYLPVLQMPNVFTGARYERLKRTILALMLRQKDLVFQAGVSPDGAKWKPLSSGAWRSRNAKIKDKKKKGQIKVLQDTGVLKNSLTRADAPYEVKSTEGNEVALGTNVPYAAIHNFGGVILKNNSLKSKMMFKLDHSDGSLRFASQKAVDKELKKKSTSKGFTFIERDIKTHTMGTYITIPARPFMGFGANDDAQVTELLEAHMSKGSL